MVSRSNLYDSLRSITYSPDTSVAGKSLPDIRKRRKREPPGPLPNLGAAGLGAQPEVTSPTDSITSKLRPQFPALRNALGESFGDMNLARKMIDKALAGGENRITSSLPQQKLLPLELQQAHRA